MKSSTSKRAAFIFTLALFALASCTSDPLPLPENSTIERTDLIIEGDIVHQDFRQSAQDDNSDDIVSYNYYGNPSENIDFIIHLQNNYKLVIRVYDAERMNPWEQVGQPYNMYPASDLEDKLSYTNVELLSPDNEAVFATNIDNATPPGIMLDVFKIVKNENGAIQCRMRDMTLYNINSADRTITINGTFVGAVTF